MPSSSSLLAFVLLAAALLVAATGVTIVLTPDELEEYQDTPFNALLGSFVTLQCNSTNFFTLYNVNRELYDNCTFDAATSKVISIFECNEPTRSFIVRLLSLSFGDNFVEYQRGQTFYYAGFGLDNINDSAPCLQRVKFAIHIINESTLSSTVQMSSTIMLQASSTVAPEVSTTPVVIQRSTTVQPSSSIARTTTVDRLPATTQTPTRTPIVNTGDTGITQKPPTDRLDQELERDAVIAAAVGTVLGVLIIIAILGVIAFLLVLILQKHQKRRRDTVVENLTEKPKPLENPLFIPALGNVDLPATPKTPKDIRFQKMYSDLEDFAAKKKRRQTWLF